MALGAVADTGVWKVTVERTVRRLAAVSWAGALLGLLVGGVGSRLGMMLLARLNPQATGVTSDDGFSMGQLSLHSVNLLVVTTLIGVFGAGVYFLLRGLMIGPRWFQILSISLGPAVVVGSQLVHADGVDFTLDPAWLAIAMFVLIPGIYAALLTVLAERWLKPESRFTRAPLWVAALPLLLWVPLAPFAAALAVILVAAAAVQQSTSGRALVAHPASAWVLRGGLTVVFTVSLVQLVQVTATLLQ